MRDDEIGLIVLPNKWEVYQSHEKGGHHIVESFDNENDACELIYKSLQAQKEYDDYHKEKTGEKKIVKRGKLIMQVSELRAAVKKHMCAENPDVNFISAFDEASSFLEAGLFL